MFQNWVGVLARLGVLFSISLLLASCANDGPSDVHYPLANENPQVMVPAGNTAPAIAPIPLDTTSEFEN